MILSGLKYLVDRTTQELIKILVKEKNITKEEAMNILYNSKTYGLLCNLETHMYSESPAYVYEWLEEELENSKQ